MPPLDKTTLSTSPETGMPTRDSKFKVYGEYSKKGWKTWGNDVTDGSSDSEIGRRISDLDNECKKRNMLISVVSLRDA